MTVDYVPTDLVSGVANMAGHDHFRMDAAMIPRRLDPPGPGLRQEPP